MGAWGAGNFENDDALDFAGELTVASAAAAVETALETAAAASSTEEGPEIDEAAYALAAAELVAAALGNPSADIPEDLDPIVSALRPESDQLCEKAQAATLSVMRKSELRELWYEDDEGSEWTAQVQDLVDRLGRR